MKKLSIIVCFMGLVAMILINAYVLRSLKTTQRELSNKIELVSKRSLTNTDTINNISGSVSTLFVENEEDADRLNGIETWIYQFNQFMFGEEIVSDSPSTEE